MCFLFHKDELSSKFANSEAKCEGLEGEKKKLKEQLDRSSQVNDDLRGKTLDKDLELESLQVITIFSNSSTLIILE